MRRWWLVVAMVTRAVSRFNLNKVRWVLSDAGDGDGYGSLNLHRVGDSYVATPAVSRFKFTDGNAATKTGGGVLGDTASK